MNRQTCLLNPQTEEICWIDLVLSGTPIEAASPSRDRLNKCISCQSFRDAMMRSMGRRSSDRLITDAVDRLLTVLANYNTELTTMAGDLERRMEEQTVLKTVAESLLNVQNLRDCLRVFLTGVTAGEAFGFNRAVVFLVNQPRRALEGQLGFGHVDLKSYSETWSHITRSRLTFSDMIREILSQRDTPDNDLTELVRKIYIPLKAEFGLLPKAVLERKSFRVSELGVEHVTDRQMLRIFGGRPCAVIPIISKEHSLGALVVDNPVTSNEISADGISILETLSYLAAAKIDNLILQNQLEVRIAELQHLHALLQDNQQYLVETERLVEAGKLATTIAHEIKTPLVTIGGYSRRALREYRKGDNIDHDLEVIIEEISRLEGIAAGVLEYSRRRRLNLTEIDLSKMISETLDILEGESVYNSVEIERNLADVRLVVRADQDRLKQVLFNLIDNAMQAMPDGGKVTVSAGASGGYVWFRVDDTGSGMTPETIDNLFVPFYTTKSVGSGLGLPVSKRIVADHGGFLEVSSSLGSGSSFTVNLPSGKKD